jgi:hypothetical protein
VRATIIVIGAVFLAGCLQTDVPDGALKCSNNPKRLCPEGYICAADGTCWKKGSNAPVPLAQGQFCSLDGECQSGHCADSRCCNVACDGQCESCEGGGCRAVTGAPHGNRQPCTNLGFEVCAAFCDGNNRAACTFPGATTSCEPQSCLSPPPALKAATACDGAGSCVPVGGGMLTTPCPAPTNGMAICAATGDACDFVCNPPYQRQGSMCM